MFRVIFVTFGGTSPISLQAIPIKELLCSNSCVTPAVPISKRKSCILPFLGLFFCFSVLEKLSELVHVASV